MGEYAAANAPLLCFTLILLYNLHNLNENMFADLKQFLRVLAQSHSALLAVIIALLLLAFGLRLEKLGEMAVRFDEAFSVWLSNMDLANFTERTASDVHPPLYYWFFHLWTRLAGTTEFAIRVQAVFFSLLALSSIYVLTFRLARSRLAAALALLLVTLSPFHIQWSQDARMYAQATFFASLALYAYWRLFSGKGARSLAFAGIRLMLTHYFGGIIVMIMLVHSLIYWRDFVLGRRKFALAIVVIAAVTLIWMVYAIGLIRQDPSHASFEPIFTYQLMATLFAVNESIAIASYLPATLLVSAIYIVGITLTLRKRNPAAALVLLGCLLPAAVISAMALPFVPFHVNALSERYFVIFSPLVFAGWGLGLTTML